ncbi:hypothetical protein PGTUg99_024418 [Puccinia graminis f. sp. tritici]|uniref:Uncharacterized protein n=1 Tax=Puccinia graminis f. sp. tritici TaxID=56615 RepID=A0A5B0NWC5_PUCGR|nr:hypothetical protein PGTUg99_024418 [Puccinia graminis f. sp. tritici]
MIGEIRGLAVAGLLFILNFEPGSSLNVLHKCCGYNKYFGIWLPHGYLNLLLIACYTVWRAMKD